MKCDVAAGLGPPDGNGADLTTDLHRASPGVGVVILSASLDPKNLQKTTVGGANEILDNFAAPDEILGAIRRIRAGVSDTV